MTVIGTCACGKPRRKGQRNCVDCHRAAQQAYRERVKRDRRAGRSLALAAITDARRKTSPTATSVRVAKRLLGSRRAERLVARGTSR